MPRNEANLPCRAEPLIEGFPSYGPLLARAFHDLYLAQSGTDIEKRRIGLPANLPHPWDPPSCIDEGLRWELWTWLDAVATWINTEYCWDPNTTPYIPACWPQHPHITHALAVLADQRRRCNLAADSNLLEHWHAYTLPGFHARLHERLGDHCHDTHQTSPTSDRVGGFFGTRTIRQGEVRSSHNGGSQDRSSADQ